MRSDRVHLRLTGSEKDDWYAAAAQDGFFHHGEANISGWLRHLAGKRVSQLESKPKRR